MIGSGGNPCDAGPMCRFYFISSDGNLYMGHTDSGSVSFVANCSWLSTGGTLCSAVNGNKYPVTTSGITWDVTYYWL